MECTETVLQNLRDAGCSEKLIEQYRQACAEPANDPVRSRRQAQILSAYRRDLLDTLHENQRRLECLDYLLFQMRESLKKKEGGKEKCT